MACVRSEACAAIKQLVNHTAQDIQDAGVHVENTRPLLAPPHVADKWAGACARSCATRSTALPECSVFPSECESLPPSDHLSFFYPCPGPNLTCR